MNAADFFKILTNLKIFGEYQDGNTHYWADRKFDNDGNVHYWISTRYEKDGEEYKAIKQIVADIPHEDK